MGKNGLTQVFENVGTMMKKRSPEILTGIGIAGMATTTVLAVKATPRALMLIEEEKRRQNYELLKAAKESGDEECDHVTQLHPIEIVRTAWKCYIPTAVMGTVSMFCLIGASSVSSRRNAALITAYTLSESRIKDYRDKVIETIGEKKEKVVRDEIAKDKVERNPVANSEVIITDRGGALCYDVLSGRYFKSDIDNVKKAVNDANHQLLNHSYISLNDFYSYIGLDDTKIGNDIGWNVSQGLIELDFSSQLASDGTPCLVLDYVNAPTYNFDKWM